MAVSLCRKSRGEASTSICITRRRWNIAEFHVVSGHESDLQPSDCWQRPLISEIGHARGGPLARLLLLTCGLLAHRVGAMREQVSPSAYHWCACGAPCGRLPVGAPESGRGGRLVRLLRRRLRRHDVNGGIEEGDGKLLGGLATAQLEAGLY